MKDYTFTTRNVIAAERDAAGETVLRSLGDVTLTLKAMTRDEIADWADITDALNTRAIDEETFRRSVEGWKVTHPEAGTVGIVFQGRGSRVHVEWYDAVNDDFFSAGWTRNLRHAVARIVNARLRAGQGLSVDAQPELIRRAVSPKWLAGGTRVGYHGKFAALLNERCFSGFRVYPCDCDDWCGRYELWAFGALEPVAQHVGHDSVTALDAEAVAA